MPEFDIFFRFKLFVLIAAVSWLTLAGTAGAAQPGIAIVVSEEAGAYGEVAAVIRSVVEARHGVGINVVSLQALAGRRIDFGPTLPDLVVAVGVRAVQDVVAQNLPVPILATLVPRQAFDKFARQRDHSQFSAVFLDQPLTRQMELIRLTLPERNRIGVVLGQESQGMLKPLQAAAKDSKFNLVVEKINTAEELLPALQRVLVESDVLLAVPDSLVFSKGTVQSVLLTTYRYQDPVIGFSHAYVRAGALAAVYTTPDQVGRQAGELIQRLLAAKTWQLPPPEYPKYFSVSVNYQVARSLGINISDESVIYQKLKSLGGVE